ncbi:helix-turn-helix domain-containing protein [Nocardiopsis sp. CNT312]|uniref:helix-turn-helix domain-containing protein n=1 Tax=Nocardiopsis sp. CNT312 TaxID=1137268 RepID=UPI00048AFDD3|nr:helix-turn-helix transcriptional regulator [Nocardiopsis sp. CNT312]
MAAALASCDMAAVLEGVREARGWSQGALARAIDYSQSWVSRVVNGQQALTVPQVHDLARRLQIPLHLIRFADDPEPNGPVPRRRPGRPITADTLFPPAPGAPGAPGAPAHPLRAGAHHSVDETTTAALRAITGGQRRMDATAPARNLLPSAMAHVHLCEQMLGHAHGTPFFGALSGAASEASGFAAWLHADQGDMGSARAHYRTAVVRARQAGMRLLDVYMLGSLAAFETDTAEDPEFGLGLVREAEHVLGPAAHPTARAWLACTEALAHASLGERSEALRAINRAERDAGGSANADPPWPWVFAFDQAKVAGYRALVGVRLRDPYQARAAFGEATAASSPPSAKQSALLQAELASAHADAGDIDEAFRLLQEALSTGLRYGSERVVGRVRSFRRRYRGPRAVCVDALDARLATLAADLPVTG